MLQSEIELEVPFHDCDPMGVTWHGCYVAYLELARSALLNRIGYNFRQMTASGFAWPVVDLKVKYVKTTTFGQRLVVSAALEEYENRLKIAYTIADRQSGDIVTKASTTQVAVDQARGEMCFVSPQTFIDKVREALTAAPRAGGQRVL
ncbi:MAG TPA: thioesterase family protein [Gammaproteobacteria bacterium]|nr:thioesterase family protein [Gammaproteobacteria bacterium]